MAEVAAPATPPGNSIDEKSHRDLTAAEPYYNTSTGEVILPTGWQYRKFPFVGWYASPKFQLGLVAFVCFLCPGMFNALGGLGAGGRTDATLADNMNTALYATFAVFGFFGGPIVNRIGVKLTLAFGGIGYCIYAISLLVSVHAHVDGFNIFAGALLGFCAGLLWTAQGTIMVSYPSEESKGRYFAWFWGIFNLGAVIGSLIPIGQNIHIHTNSTVNDGTYIAFIVLMFIGAVLALTLANAGDVVRHDGSRVILQKNPTVKSEFLGMIETIQHNPLIITLFPMFWTSNWFTTYQQNGVNAAYFDTRTRALNNLLYYLAQIVGAALLGYALDTTWARRTVRAKVNWIFLFVITIVIWGSGYAWERKYTRADVKAADFKPMDWNTPGYVGPMFLYIFYGLYDSLWQASVYWYMGALSNSGRRVANIVGFYKGIQSAGAAVMWSMDSHKVSYLNEWISNIVLLGGSLLIAAPIIFLRIKDTTSIEEDLVGTNETLADVLPATGEKNPPIAAERNV